MKVLHLILVLFGPLSPLLCMKHESNFIQNEMASCTIKIACNMNYKSHKHITNLNILMWYIFNEVQGENK
jgi:hypothetical protein